MNVVEPDSAWRQVARQELRRGRRYLLSLTRDLSDEELEWVGDRERVGCVKWHAAQVVRNERDLLRPLVPSLSQTPTA